MPEEEIRENLMKIKGVGNWTVDMMLISYFGMENVFSKSDATINRVCRQLYGENIDIDGVSDIWKPYRTYASKYLWKYADNSD